MLCTKNDALDESVRYKAWLVAKEHSHVVEVDFSETFAPMAKLITIRCIFTLREAMDWEIHQIHVKMVIFNEILEVYIYMDQPEGFVQVEKKYLMCKLEKVLYGLKQSPMVWYHRIDSFFINEGFHRSQADHLLYIIRIGEYLLVAILYVNNLIILASNVTKLKWLNSDLKKKFEINDLE